MTLPDATTNGHRPTTDELCAWIAADGADTTRVTDAEMARLIYYLSITLASRLSVRLDLNPVHREDAREAAHGAASHMRQVRTLVERQDAVNREQEEHRHEPAAPQSCAGVDLGDDGYLSAAERIEIVESWDDPEGEAANA